MIYLKMQNRGKMKKSTNQEGIRNLCLIAYEQLQHNKQDAERRFVIRTVLRRAVEKTSGSIRSNKLKCNYISDSARQELEYNFSELRADHVVPLSHLYKQLNKKSTVDSLINLCHDFSTTCLITKSEDDVLNKLGLRKTLPDGLTNKWSRYKKASIEYTEITPEYLKKIIQA